MREHSKRVKVIWTHPRREMVEILCHAHEQQVLFASRTLGIAVMGERADNGASCMRCQIEETGQEPRFAYGLAG